MKETLHGSEWEERRGGRYISHPDRKGGGRKMKDKDGEKVKERRGREDGKISGWEMALLPNNDG